MGKPRQRAADILGLQHQSGRCCSRASERTGKIYQLNPSTGKIVFWKEFGADLLAGGTSVGSPHFSADGKAYAYVYIQDLSQAYTITGLK